MRNGARVASIRGNPVTYRIDQMINHGTTALFDAWWTNWCMRIGTTFSVRGAIGALTASAPYNVLPVCLGAGMASRLRGVRYTALSAMIDSGQGEADGGKQRG